MCFYHKFDDLLSLNNLQRLNILKPPPGPDWFHCFFIFKSSFLSKVLRKPEIWYLVVIHPMLQIWTHRLLGGAHLTNQWKNQVMELLHLDVGWKMGYIWINHLLSGMHIQHPHQLCQSWLPQSGLSRIWTPQWLGFQATASAIPVTLW